MKPLRRSTVSQRLRRPPTGSLACTVSCAACSAALAVTGAARAATADNWVGPTSGSWNTAGNWDAGHVPAGTDAAYVTNLANVTVTFDAPSGGAYGVVVGSGTDGLNTLVIPGNVFSANTFSVGYSGPQSDPFQGPPTPPPGVLGRGAVVQSGGSVTAGQLDVGSLLPGDLVGSTYTLSGTASTLTVNTVEYLAAGGSGTFTQNGGRHTIGSGGTLYVGYTPGSVGTYKLNAGTLNAAGATELVGGFGSGAVTQLGGTNAVGALTLDASAGTASYSIGGGVLQVANALTVARSGSTGAGAQLIDYGPSLATANALFVGGGSGTSAAYFFLSKGGAVLRVAGDETIGDNVGDGTFDQYGSTNTVGGSGGLFIAGASNRVGTYTLGGHSNEENLTVHLGGTHVGQQGTGVFTQLSGTHTTRYVLLGEGPAASGTYAMSGGVLNVTALGGGSAPTNGITVGTFGSTAATNAFLQTGGTVTTTALLLNAGSYSLSNAATLTVSGVETIAASGAAAFTQFGGLNTVGWALNAGTSRLEIGGAMSVAGGTTRVYGDVGVANRVAITGGSFVASGTGTVQVGEFYPGTVTLSAGGLNAATLRVGSNHANSSLSVNGGQLAATHLLVGDKVVGDGNGYVGTVAFNAGVAQLGALDVNLSGSGAVTLAAPAALNVSGTETVNTGSATAFTQTGGTHASAQLLLPGAPGASGVPTFLLSGGSLSVSDTESIGYAGQAWFQQSGGTHTAQTFYIGRASNQGAIGGPGRYDLLGGTLTVAGAETLGPGTFNQGGGANSTHDLNVGWGGVNHTTYAMSNAATLSVAGALGVGTGAAGLLQLTGNATATAGALTVGTVSSTGGTVNLLSGTLLVTGPTTIAARGALNVEDGGTFVGQAVNSTGSITLGPTIGTTANATFGSVNATSVTVSDGGRLHLATAASVGGATNAIDALTITPNGKVDVANQSLLTRTAPATVAAYVANGNNFGLWDGKGGISSSWVAAHPGYGLGYGTAADGVAGLGAGQTLVKPALLGDTTLKGSVGFADYQRLLGNFGKATGATWAQGDTDYDGAVTFGDFQNLLGNFGQTSVVGAPAPGAKSATPVAKASVAAAAAQPQPRYALSVVTDPAAHTYQVLLTLSVGDNAGLADFGIDVLGTGGDAVVSSRAAAPRGFNVDQGLASGFSSYVSNGNKGVEITASQPLIYPGDADDPTLDQLVYQGVGQQPGTRDGVTWGYPVVIATGTYSGDDPNGLVAQVHPQEQIQVLRIGSDGQWQGPSNVLRALPVPEPAGAASALAFLAIGGCPLRGRRRRRAASH